MLPRKLFEDADRDIHSIPLDGYGYQGRLVTGVKIVMDNETQEIKIYNTSLGGDFYTEVTKRQYKIFETDGWYAGIKSVQISNLKRKIRNTIRLMHLEPNNGRRVKTFEKKIKKLKDELQQLERGRREPFNRKEG
jgi:thiamine kinase-like enzyme